ncbi:MAG: ribosome-associated translation inhibitor RaiA [Gammaproteobacteria bacterium]|nr:ribosome-associated translation inhibitor RaiA [Gammaproteobacteria bacterium]
MQINLTGHHVDITPALRDYVTGKIEKLTRHFDHLGQVHVVLTVSKLVHRAEATIHVRGQDLFADAESENMYAAIDALVDKLDRQVVKFKEKQGSHRNGII